MSISSIFFSASSGNPQPYHANRQRLPNRKQRDLTLSALRWQKAVTHPHASSPQGSQVRLRLSAAGRHRMNRPRMPIFKEGGTMPNTYLFYACLGVIAGMGVLLFLLPGQ